MRLRVVWGLRITMASFSPTNAFSSVDCPALGRPMMETKPERNAISGLHLLGIGNVLQSDTNSLDAALGGLQHFESQAILLEHLARFGNVSGQFADQTGDGGCLFFVRAEAEDFLQQVEVGVAIENVGRVAL